MKRASGSPILVAFHSTRDTVRHLCAVANSQAWAAPRFRVLGVGMSSSRAEREKKMYLHFPSSGSTKVIIIEAELKNLQLNLIYVWKK